jgi:uncharacterized membrane protein
MEKLLNFRHTIIAIILVTIMVTMMMSGVGEIPKRVDPYTLTDCIGGSILLIMIAISGVLSGYEIRKNEDK